MEPFDGERLRRAMAARGVHVVVATSRHNVEYLTGGYYNPFFAWSPRFGTGQYLSAVAVPAARLESAFYVSRENERDFLHAFGPLWIADVHWAPRRPNIGVEVAAKTAEVLRARGLAGGTIAVEFPFLPVDAFEVLRRDLPEAALVDASPILAEVRAIKRPVELERLEVVHRITSEAIRATIAAGRSDHTMRDVARAVQRQVEQRGGRYLYALTNVGPGLVRAATSEPWGHGRPLHVDAGAERGGYRSDVARMGSIGPAPARALELFDACVQAQTRIRGRIGPDLSARELWKIGTDAVAAGPWGRFGKFQAHGLGMVSHELPEVTRDADGALEVGMVISVETDCLDPDTGHIKLEDTVVVTATGCAGLGDAHRDWCVAAGT
jgi:Xaa-Pro aminopeptidase